MGACQLPSWIFAKDPNRLILDFILKIIAIVIYCAEIFIKIVIVERPSTSPGPGR